MRIMIDIDGTIAELKKHGQDYSELRANPGAVEKMKELKAAGHYIILQTARHMKTCGGDQGQIVAKIGKKTLDWLEKNQIPYDEIYFGKPYADVYLDDLAHTFRSWDAIQTADFNKQKVQILIPMAGAGSRFAQAGFKEPKPLIDVLGEPMVAWAMKSFDFLNTLTDYQFIFVIQEAHEREFGLEAELKKMFGEKSVVVKLNYATRGQAETCLATKEYINNYNKLFIYNCDTYSTSKIWDLIEAEDPDGVLACFTSNDSRYSFAKLDQFGFVCETAEKKAISDLASNGMYYFKRGADFVAAAEMMIQNGEMHNNEFYVAPCYNELLKAGKKIRTVLTETNHVMGTPEELEQTIRALK